MVENWSTPERLKELQSFLGYISYYRRCVPWLIIYGRNGSFLTWLATSRGKSRSTVISASPRGQCSILNKFRIWKEGHIQMRENRSSYLVG